MSVHSCLKFAVLLVLVVFPALCLSQCFPSSSIVFTSTDRVNVNGIQMNVKGVSWWGLEGGSYVMGGLGQVSMDSILSFVASNGFNLLRIPFQADMVLNLNSRYPSGINYNINPDLQSLSSIQVLDVLFTKAASHGLLILLDLHWFDNTQTNDPPPLWYSSSCTYDSAGFCDSVSPACISNKDGVCVFYTEQVVEGLWATMVNRYKTHWNFFGIDIENEMHEPALWGTGSPSLDYAAAAERMIDYILTNAGTGFNGLILVEGIGNTPLNTYCENTTVTTQSYWWGGNLEPVNCHQLSISSMNKLVYSPHTYGPSVYDQGYFDVPNFPNNMPLIWDTMFAFVRALTGKPILTGEWGGPLTGKTQTWSEAFVQYLISKDMRDTIYWAVNPNSGETDGLLQYDWTTPTPGKLMLLSTLQPNPTVFTVNGNNVCVSGGPTSSATTSSATTSTSSATTSSATTSSTTTASSSTASTTASSSITATTASSSTTSSVSSTTGSTAGCYLSISQSSVGNWVNDGQPQAQYNVVFRNTSPSQTITALQVGLSAQPAQYWSVTLNADGSVGFPNWVNSLPPGQTLSWGYIANGIAPLTMTVIQPECTPSTATTASSTTGSSTSASGPTTSSGPTTLSSTSSSTTTSSGTTTSSSTSTTGNSAFLQISATASSQWVDSTGNNIQENVVFTNVSPQPITSLRFFLSGTPYQIWSITANSDGSYTFPSWMDSLSPGQQLSWGYIARSSQPLTITIVSP